jgi:hypothetical protein
MLKFQLSLRIYKLKVNFVTMNTLDSYKIFNMAKFFSRVLKILSCDKNFIALHFRVNVSGVQIGLGASGGEWARLGKKVRGEEREDGGKV